MATKTGRNSINYPHVTRITWTRVPNWNEMCAWAIEHFGLPGSRYITHATEDYMEWMFNSIEDQLFFTLAWGNDQ
jgi:hypothetical protein